MSTQQHKPHTKILPEAELTVPKNFDDDHPISFAKSGGKSVGIVTPQKIHFDTPLTLECNRMPNINAEIVREHDLGFYPVFDGD